MLKEQMSQDFRSSYQKNITYGNLLEGILFDKNPRNILEFGILDGYSLQYFAKTGAKVFAFDIFEDFVGNGPPKDIRDRFNHFSNVSIEYGDYYKKYEELPENKFDIIHIDIANNGDVYKFAFDNYLDLLEEDGLMVLEGGSEKRDEVEWMEKYKKTKIKSFLENASYNIEYKTIGDFPSITIVKKKKNISLFKVFMCQDVKQKVPETLLSGYITQGKKVDQLEQELSKMFDHPYILTLNSATSGLTLALRMAKDKLGLGQKDEVLTSPLTCMATNEPILANGLSIKWVDVDKETCNICLTDLEKKLTKNTKIIMFVHWGGYPVDLDLLDEILERNKEKLGFKPVVIEDCAHAFLSEYKGKKLGTHGNYAVFSTQAIKHFTTGDGGLLFCPTKEDYDKAKLLRWFGIDRDKRNYKGKDFRLEHDVKDWGYKFHMNDINAVIGLCNLPYISRNIEKCRENALFLTKNYKKGKILHPYDPENITKSSYWLFSVWVEEKEEYIKEMKKKGIMISQVHQRNDTHSCFADFTPKGGLPNLDELEKHLVCIPCGWWLDEKDLMF